jgi:hypothetical protein
VGEGVDVDVLRTMGGRALSPRGASAPLMVGVAEATRGMNPAVQAPDVLVVELDGSDRENPFVGRFEFYALLVEPQL